MYSTLRRGYKRLKRGPWKKKGSVRARIELPKGPQMRCEAEALGAPGEFWGRVDPHHIYPEGYGGVGACSCRENIIWLSEAQHRRVEQMGIQTYFRQSEGLWERYLIAKDHHRAYTRGVIPCSPRFKTEDTHD
jgi:hypothetical protein